MGTVHANAVHDREATHNAILCASAPELLEASESFLDAMLSVETADELENTLEYEDLRTALAKARGQRS